MIQLQVLSGKKAGTTINASKFPFQVGRASSCGLTLEDAGIWDQHFEITWPRRDTLELKSSAQATTAVNGAKVNEIPLHEGDLIEAGAVKMRFTFGPVRQRSLAVRELLTWIALGALSLGQVALIYQLLR